jgi:hypothetical protein
LDGSPPHNSHNPATFWLIDGHEPLDTRIGVRLGGAGIGDFHDQTPPFRITRTQTKREAWKD